MREVAKEVAKTVGVLLVLVALIILFAFATIRVGRGAEPSCDLQRCPNGNCPTWSPAPSQDPVWASTPSFRQQPRPTQVARAPAIDGRQAIVRIESKLGNRSRWISGTALQDGLILTCVHGLGEGWQPIIHWPGGHTTPATIIETAGLADLAVLKTTPPTGAISMKIAPDAAERGDVVWTAGYAGIESAPGTARLAFTSGPVLGYRAADMVVSSNAKSGMSGGPIYTARGLVGVLTTVEYDGPPRIMGPGLRLIREVLQRIRCRPATVIHVLPGPSEAVGTLPGPVEEPALEPEVDYTAILIQLQALQHQIEAIPAGPPGPAGIDGINGIDGLPGKTGLPGPAGRNAEPIDIEAVTAEVLKRLPPYPASYDVTPR